MVFVLIFFLVIRIVQASLSSTEAPIGYPHPPQKNSNNKKRNKQ